MKVSKKKPKDMRWRTESLASGEILVTPPYYRTNEMGDTMPPGFPRRMAVAKQVERILNHYVPEA